MVPPTLDPAPPGADRERRARRGRVRAAQDAARGAARGPAASPAPSTAASWASAAPARCCVDGEPVLSCLVLGARVRGPRRSTTVEGLAADGRLAPAAGGLRRPRRGAVRLLHAGVPAHGARRCSTANPNPTRDADPRGAVRATSAAAPATCRSSRRSRWPPRLRRRERPTAPTPAPAGGGRAMSSPSSHGGVVGTARRRVDGRAKVTGQTRSPTTWCCRACCTASCCARRVPHARIRVDRRVAGAARIAGRASRCSPATTSRSPSASCRSARTSTRSAATACASSATRWPRWSPRDEDDRVRGAAT